ncbi:response regulator [Aliikangiella marina]|uniref:Response regulator n=1 Tax=Aliikangiella marina TaxID=1712262 RepID=A0A545T4C3_9GAMM|nr:response regulator [Aliikangiella marina]TQV72076.1 response regulator [Aliikangiella marina]
MTESGNAKKREEVLKKYLANLSKNIAKLEEMWGHLRHVQWNQQVLSSLKLLTHKLLGGALALHLHKIAYDLKSLDYNLAQIDDDSGAPNFQDNDLIEQCILALKATSNDLANHKPEKVIDNSSIEVSNLDKQEKLLYIVDDDQVIRDLLAGELEACGYQVNLFENLQSLYDSLNQETPSLVILDIVFPEEGALAGVDALKHLRSQMGLKIPVIFISARSDMVARLRCLRAGGNAFFGKPVEIKPLVEKIEELTPDDQTRHRALIIDDDEISLELHADQLQSANFKVRKVNNPLNAMKEINQFQPDVLLLDMKMPMCNGLELADVLRQDNHFTELPIIFITGDNSEETRQQAEAVENSQFLTKPVERSELLDASLTAARQYAVVKHKQTRQKPSSKQSPIKKRQQFIENLDRVINGRSSELEQYHLYYLVLDNINNVKQHVGLRNLDEINSKLFKVILPQLSPQDSVTSVTDGALLLLIKGEFDHSWDLANQLINELDHIAYTQGEESLKTSASIGMFSLNTPIANSIDSIAYAEAAVNQAKNAGGNKVVAVLNAHNKTIDESAQMVLSEKLESAIRDKAYILNFQTIATSENSDFQAFEVLVRLKDDMGRQISPIKFFETARNLDAIVEMDRWIYSATTQAMQSDKTGLMSAKMFLKVSTETLSYNLLPTIVNGLIQESRILGERRLIFMLDQSSIENHLEQSTRFAEAIHHINCDIALENYDYHQSFDIIEALKPGYIKLNASLINEAMKSAHTQVDLKSFIGYCKNRGISIIAAQIEEESTLDICKTLGIKLFEGFFIQKPTASLQQAYEANRLWSESN